MSAKIIAVANMKGGVGKTATVVSLAEALAASGYRVLVIDLDAQANASICLAGDKLLAELMRDGLTIEGLLHDQLIGRKTLTAKDCIRNNVSNVSHLREQLAISLLPSSPELRNFEMRIIHTLTRAKLDWEEIVKNLSAVMKLQLSKTKGNHDFVLIDCAPGISALTEVSVRLADLVIVPTIADFLSTFGLQNFCATLATRGLGDSARKPKRLPRVLITRRKQVKLQHEMVDILRNETTSKTPAFGIFHTEVPETIRVAEALSLIKTYPSFTEKWSSVAGVLNDLANEVKEVLDVDHA
jgi:cellulose biosynthesis protein BcsQ